MISRFEQFLYVISKIHRQIQKIERAEMEKQGYKGAFAQYLATLYSYEEGLTSSELCEICDRDKAAVSRIIAEMEEKGLVTREKKIVRTYRSKITLTEKGKETAEYVSETSKLAVAAVSGGIFDQVGSREAVYATLDELYRNLQKVAEEGIPSEKSELE